MREDLQKVIDEFNSKFSKKDILRIDEVVEKTETILFAAPTNCTINSVNTKKAECYPGIAILTENRFIFTSKAFLDWKMETISVSEIQAINCSGNGLTGGHVQIHTLVKSYDILVSYKKDMIQNIERVFETAKNNAAAPSAPTSSGEDVFAQIEKLSALRDKGILSDEEFQAKKQELLAKI